MSHVVATIQFRDATASERAKDPRNQLLDKADAAMAQSLMSKTNQIVTSSTNELATLARYHTRLIIMSIDDNTPPATKLDLACDVVSFLRHAKPPAIALRYHFEFLATIVLFELLKVEETSSTARACLEDFQNALSVTEVDPGFWDRDIRTIVANRLNLIQGQAQGDSDTNKQGLQHLADAAIKEGQGGEQGSSDMAEAIRKAEAAATAKYGSDEHKLKMGGYLGALL